MLRSDEMDNDNESILAIQFDSKKNQSVPFSDSLSISLSLVWNSSSRVNSSDGTSEGFARSFPKDKRGDKAMEEASLSTLRIDRSVIMLRDVSDKYSSSGIFVSGRELQWLAMDCPSGILRSVVLLYFVPPTAAPKREPSTSPMFSQL